MTFLDEPTVGLDPRIRYELLDLIGGMRASEDMTVLLTTHYLDEAERLCDRVAIVHEGRIVALDSPDTLLAGLGRAIVEVRVQGRVELCRLELGGLQPVLEGKRAEVLRKLKEVFAPAPVPQRIP